MGVGPSCRPGAVRPPLGHVDQSRLHQFQPIEEARDLISEKGRKLFAIALSGECALMPTMTIVC